MKQSGEGRRGVERIRENSRGAKRSQEEPRGEERRVAEKCREEIIGEEWRIRGDKFQG